MATALDEVLSVREGFSGLGPPRPGEVTITGSDPVFSTSRSGRPVPRSSVVSASLSLTSGK